MNWYKYAQNIMLLKMLNALKPQMVSEAQQIYDSWDQNEDGVDEEYGCGGICDQISQSIGSLIVSSIDNADVIDGGQDGDDHAWIIVKMGNEAFGIDIPPDYYEIGSGYCWKKRPNVIFTTDMIEIFKINIKNLPELDEYE